MNLFPISNLVFVKQDNVFQASVETIFRIENKNSELQMSRVSYNKEITKEYYDETRTKELYPFEHEFLIDKDEYNLIVSIKDLDSYNVWNNSSNIKKTDEKYLQFMENFMKFSSKKYNSLLSNKQLRTFFEKGTPVKLLETLNIGSRPIKRNKKSSDVKNYRAISWVFGWSQPRYTITGWYGVGTALKELIDAEGVKSVINYINNYPFIKTLLFNNS